MNAYKFGNKHKNKTEKKTDVKSNALWPLHDLRIKNLSETNDKILTQGPEKILKFNDYSVVKVRGSVVRNDLNRLALSFHDFFVVEENFDEDIHPTHISPTCLLTPEI